MSILGEKSQARQPLRVFACVNNFSLLPWAAAAQSHMPGMVLLFLSLIMFPEEVGHREGQSAHGPSATRGRPLEPSILRKGLHGFMVILAQPGALSHSHLFPGLSILFPPFSDLSTILSTTLRDSTIPLSKHCISYNPTPGAGETARWMRTHTALPDDLSSALSQTACDSRHPLLTSLDTAFMYTNPHRDTHICT